MTAYPEGQHDMNNQSITLSPEEYQALMTELAARDPIMRMLMQKQDEAQRQATRGDLSMHVVGGAA